MSTQSFQDQRKRLGEWWNRRGWRLARFTLAAMAMSCSGEIPTDPLTPSSQKGNAKLHGGGLQLTPNSLTLVQDSSFALSTGGAATWVSRDNNVAMVNSTGLVTAINPGTTVVAASVGHGKKAFEDSAWVTVIARTTQEAATITLSPAPIFLKMGDSVMVTDELKDANGRVVPDTASHSWSSSDSLVALVSANGMVRSLAAGGATITLRVGKLSAADSLIVNSGAVSQISLSSSNVSLRVLDSAKVVATLLDAGGRPVRGNITWTSSNTGVANVVTGITANLLKSAALNVNGEPPTGRAKSPVLGRVARTTGAPKATVAGLKPSRDMAISNTLAAAPTPGVATIYASAAGSTTITATAGGVSASVAVTVTSLVARVSITPAVLTVPSGSAGKLTLDVRDGSGAAVPISQWGASVGWASLDATVATVDPTGSVTGVNAGTTQIQASVLGVNAQATVVVQQGTVAAGGPGTPLSGKQFIGDDFRGYNGSTQTLYGNISNSTGVGTGEPTLAFYDDGAHVNQISMDAATPYNNHASLKMVRSAGDTAVPNLWKSFGAIDGRAGSDRTSIWVREKIRWGTGYSASGLTPQFNCDRFVAVVHTSCDLVGYAWLGSDTRGTTTLGPVSSYYAVWLQQEVNNMPDININSTSPQWAPGPWYDYVMYYQQTSATTWRLRSWIGVDGTAPALMADAGGTYSTDQLPNMRWIALGMNEVPSAGAAADQSFWIGQWEAVDATTNADPYGLLNGVLSNRLSNRLSTGQPAGAVTVPRPRAVPRLQPGIQPRIR